MDKVIQGIPSRLLNLISLVRTDQVDIIFQELNEFYKNQPWLLLALCYTPIITNACLVEKERNFLSIFSTPSGLNVTSQLAKRKYELYSKLPTFQIMGKVALKSANTAHIKQLKNAHFKYLSQEPSCTGNWDIWNYIYLLLIQDSSGAMTLIVGFWEFMCLKHYL